MKLFRALDLECIRPVPRKVSHSTGNAVTSGTVCGSGNQSHSSGSCPEDGCTDSPFAAGGLESMLLMPYSASLV